jgi:hypothetical protein
MASPEAPENPGLAHISEAGAESENVNLPVDQDVRGRWLAADPGRNAHDRCNEPVTIAGINESARPCIALLAGNTVVTCGHSIPPRGETSGFPGLAQVASRSSEAGPDARCRQAASPGTGLQTPSSQ